LNIQAQRKPFVEKRDSEYDKSNVYITRDLKHFDEWSVDLIDLRTEWLAEMFDLVWSEDEASIAQVVKFSEWRKIPKRAHPPLD
jgi:hypothetical protein